MRSLRLAFAALLLLGAPLAAQRWPLAEPLRTSLDEVFDFVEREAPGCALGVIEHRHLAYANGYGLANLDWGVPISSTTVFDIGSVSKQFTAAAVALLEIDGTLSLDDPVRKWIPELPEYERPITLRHLLHHTSGLRDYLTLMSLAGLDFADTFDEDDGVEIIARQRALNFEPGSEHLYSNSGYLLLAAVVRRATGHSLREFLERRVFDPLGMAHTSIWDDATEVLHERATGYSLANGKWRIDHAWNFQMGGDGQVITSVEDLAKWDANFYDPKVGGQPLLDRLHRQGVLSDGETLEYALGLVVDEHRGLRRVQHGGAWAGFRAMLARYPEEHTSIIVLCNRGDVSAGRYATKVAEVVLADRFTEPAETDPETTKREPVELTRDQLARWPGTYRGESTTLIIELRENGLVLQAGGDTYPLEPYGESDFTITGVGVPLRFAEESGKAKVTVDGERTYERIDLSQPTAQELQAAVGSYQSPEIDARYQITLENGTLTLHRPNRDPTPLTPIGKDAFTAAGLDLTFERKGRRVTAFTVNAGRVTGILFARSEE